MFFDSSPQDLIIANRTRSACRSPCGTVLKRIGIRSADPTGDARRSADFMRRYYKRCYSRFAGKPTPPDTQLPDNYDRHLRRLRQQLRLTQSDFASRIGAAAGKTVVYQWETRKRRLSPVFWKQIAALAMNT
jgi:DNA-binding XRE family transcriptional regulator